MIHTLFYDNYNYGAMLQAYGLYHTLESMGMVCVELNYTGQVSNKRKKIFYRGYRILEIMHAPISYIRKKKNASILQRQRERYISETGDPLKKMFDLFMEKEFHSTKLYSPDSIGTLSGYDFYVAGGDQVWNPDWTEGNYFFAGVSDGKKIGYSCSAGKDFFTKRDKNKIYKLAKNMDVISVREKNFSELLTEGNIKNQIIADPVFLMTKEEWGDFANDKYDLPEKYIFAYILGNDEESRVKVKTFAENNDLPIVSIPHVLRYYIEADEDFADIKIYDSGPREFVSLVKNAAFVLTDSFHGTAFSLLFEKQFLNFCRCDRRSLNARLENVVKEYGLKNRLISVNELEHIEISNLEPISYNICQKITEMKRSKAIAFLKDTLR